MTVREITISDYENLVSFWEKNYFVSEMDSHDRLELFLNKNPDLSILAEENGIILGTALGSFDGRRGYLQKVVVDKNFRKQGLGQELVENVVDKLKNLGAVYIPIAIEQEYVSFYENRGFKKSSQVPMGLDIKQS